MRSAQRRPLLIGIALACLFAVSGCVGASPSTDAPTASTTPVDGSVDLRAFVPRGTEGSGASIRLTFEDGLVPGSVGTMQYLQNFTAPGVGCAAFPVTLEEVGASTVQISGALAVVPQGDGGRTVAPAFIIPGDPVRAAFTSREVLVAPDTTPEQFADSGLTELEGLTLLPLYPTTDDEWERFAGRVLDDQSALNDQVC
ncbi:hypothetical protein KXS11_13985 [Plantibacter flavus]|uniref:hypothetical protein n=1 Tax=Plantibacter flavus TaxID=150123 RepID=UPI003F15D19E